MRHRAIVLLSGGLDSATCFAIAKLYYQECFALTFDYGQRHRVEIDAATTLAANMGAKKHSIVSLDLSFLTDSALINHNIELPEQDGDGVPVTYVPARNVIFLSYALSWADSIGAEAIYIGVNALDFDGYPDCRRSFIEAFQHTINVATKKTTQGHTIELKTPLIGKCKSQIIQIANALYLDFANCVSCYSARAVGEACGKCTSCRLRKSGFESVNISDQITYLG